MSYEDYSGASGQVYTDKVTIGGKVSVNNQSIGVAKTVSKSFYDTLSADGLIGLAFSDLNSILPSPQKTWFDNVRLDLEKPLFAAALKRRTIGSYDFGYIDDKKYIGPINWVPVTPNTGYWDFVSTGFTFGNQTLNITLHGTIDTGSSLWYLPRSITDTYYGEVSGARYSRLQAGWIFPCNSVLPDISVMIGGVQMVVPGINLNFQSLGGGNCYGGLQRDISTTSYIFGDIFLKGLYVIFEHPRTGPSRLGFAQQRL
jgi:hypothetical protein